uniref:PH domain-containing protein n=1 Tax=Heliothis virescens TaxID=7102 RepID=A0A2A4JY19_HELVI
MLSTDETSPEDEDNTVSSASLCMSPTSVTDSSIAGIPIFASTPLVAKPKPMTNGHDVVDNKRNSENNNDTVNGNVNVTIVSESVNSMDVLSGGESDAGDTLSRRNNNSISSGMLGTLREVGDAPKKRHMDITYFVAKELLMTERTYKRDLELVTVKWSNSVSALAAGGGAGEGAGAALARACLALEPLALSTGKLLARLDRLLANSTKPDGVSVVQFVRGLAKLFTATQSESAAAALELASHAANEAREQLQHGENHAALCQLQRDIAGYDKLLVAEREFIRMGCVYKHSSRGLQQRMLFLFSDILVVTSKAGSAQFRAHLALPLHALTLKHSELPHSFTLTGGEDTNLLLSATNDLEFTGWYRALQAAIDNARDKYTDVDTELTPYEQEIGESSPAAACGGGLAHVCWHRFTSLDTTHLHLAMRTQLSGYLLRKFKKSPGWQKLWVVFAVSTLFFYKSWQDETPLASLPLLGYSVGAPVPDDNIDKDFVFKLQFKNHVYFFRADSQYTFNRWTEVLQTATMRPEH